MSEFGDQVRATLDASGVSVMRESYAEEYPDKDERLVRMIEDALHGFRMGGARFDSNDLDTVALALGSGLLDLGLSFSE